MFLIKFAGFISYHVSCVLLSLSRNRFRLLGFPWLIILHQWKIGTLVNFTCLICNLQVTHIMDITKQKSSKICQEKVNRQKYCQCLCLIPETHASLERTLNIFSVGIIKKTNSCCTYFLSFATRPPRPKWTEIVANLFHFRRMSRNSYKSATPRRPVLIFKIVKTFFPVVYCMRKKDDFWLERL